MIGEDFLNIFHTQLVYNKQTLKKTGQGAIYSAHNFTVSRLLTQNIWVSLEGILKQIFVKITISALQTQ